MSFGMYMIGFVVLVLGLAYAAFLAHVPTQWIAVGVIIMVGIGIMTAVTRTRQRDPSN